jgi:hypothetical protein
MKMHGFTGDCIYRFEVTKPAKYGASFQDNAEVHYRQKLSGFSFTSSKTLQAETRATQFHPAPSNGC